MKFIQGYNAFKNGLIRLDSAIKYHLITNAYTYDAGDTLARVLLNEYLESGYTPTTIALANTVSTPTYIDYKIPPIYFENLSSGSTVNGLVISIGGYAFEYFSIDAILTNGITIAVKWTNDIAFRIYPKMDRITWIIQRYKQKNNISVLPDEDLLREQLYAIGEENMNGTIYFCPFNDSIPTEGYVMELKDQYYSLFEDKVLADSGVIHDQISTEEFLQDSIFESSIMMCNFDASKAGVGYIAEPYLFEGFSATGSYAFYGNSLVPEIEVLRYSSDTALAVFVANENRPNNAYDLKIYVADDYRNQPAHETGWTQTQDGFYQYKSGFSDKKAYKVSASYTAAGTVNGSPVTLESKRSPRRIPHASKLKV